MAKLDDIKLPEPVQEPVAELSPWFTEHFDIDHEVIDHNRIVIEFRGRKLLVVGSFNKDSPIKGGWWHLRVEGNVIKAFALGDPVEKRQDRLVRAAMKLRVFQSPSPTRKTEAEKLLPAAAPWPSPSPEEEQED